MVFHIYAIKYSQVQEIFFHVFRERKFLLFLLNGQQVLQLVLNSSLVKAQISYEMSEPVRFERQLYFYVVTLLSREDRKES